MARIEGQIVIGRLTWCSTTSLPRATSAERVRLGRMSSPCGPTALPGGAAAATHYSFMGYILQPRQLLASTAPAIAARMAAEAVDVALLVPV